MFISSTLIWLVSCLFRLTPAEQERVITIQQVRFHEDESRALSFEQVHQRRQELFRFKADYIPTDYNPQSAYWIELDFCIENQEKNYLLEFYDQTIDSLEIYLKYPNDSTFRHFRFGDQFPFDKRNFNHKNFEVALDEYGQYSGYVRITSREYADVRFAIRTIGRFVDYALSEYFLYGIFYGMILIISLYNVSIYSAIREIKYLYYTFYIISVGLFAMCVDGIAFQLLWPGSPGWNQIAHGVALFSIIFWSIVFSKRFLNLRERAPLINQLLNLVLILRSLVFLYALVWDHSVLNLRNIELVPLSLIFVGSILCFMRGYKPARFFIVAYGFLFLGFIIKALLMMAVIPFRTVSYSRGLQIISYYSLHICFVFEMLFLSIALSDRVRILKQNRDRAYKRILAQQDENIRYKDKVNSELEDRIAERTREIAEKNEQLQDYNEILAQQKKEISEINSLLDLDNWKLRNNLKSIQTERLLNRTLSFGEFCELFPGRAESLKFLSEHKWKHGFECRKCGNTKYLDGTTIYARRCTKCGYNETPTADSLFHGLKFPLPKALYILYLTINDDNRSIQNLSEEMDLRKNTVWSFKRKVQAHIEQNGKSDLLIFEDLATTS